MKLDFAIELEFQKLEFFEKKNLKFSMLFFMELEFHQNFSKKLEFVKFELLDKLEYFKKVVNP